MSQVPLNNVSFSNLINNMYNSNINNPISFSKLYNFSPDIYKYGDISIKSLTSKYRNFVPTDINSLVIWYDANNNNNVYNLKNLSSNIFNATLNNEATYNKYGLNTLPCISINSNNYYKIDNIDINTKNLTIAMVIINNNINNNIINGGIYNNINNIIINNNTINNYINKPIIYLINLYIDTNNSLNINFRYNGKILNNINTGIITTTINLNNTITFFSNFNGSFSELLIYNNVINNSNIYLIESYLASKWWSVPSYVLPNDHMYYNINPPNLLIFPSLLYLFDNNNIEIINHGNQGNLLNGIITNNYINYSYQYSSNSNNLLIFYKFDNNNSNNGLLSDVFNFNILSGSINYNNINKIRGTHSIYLNNSSINTSISYNSSIIDFSTNTEYTIILWYYINSYNINDRLFYINNDISFILQRNGSTNDLIFKNIIIENAMIVDGKWKNLTLILKKQNNNMLVSIYLNSFLYIDNYICSNTWLFNNVIYNSFIINYNTDIYYDEFRLYNKCLNIYEIQEILQLPYSLQKSYNNNDNYGFLFNTYNFNDNNTNFEINYNNIINNCFNTNNYITISFNIIIYNSFILINILHISNILKISFKNNTANIFIEINYINYRKTYIYNNDNISHNYKFVIFLSNDINLYYNNTLLFIDNIFITSSTVFNDLPGGDFFNSSTNFFYIGNYYNIIYKNYTTSPFLLENFQIYNFNLSNSNIIYNNHPNYDYYKYKNFAFTSIILNNGLNNINYIGPTYDNLITPYNTSNYLWINNTKFFNVYNGIQIFLVPSSGFYNFIVAGASGGNSFSTKINNYGGRGIILTNNIYLNKNDILYIGVGQIGNNGSSMIYNNNLLQGQGGGGGMSIVFNYTSNFIVLISGGGGGNGQNSIGVDATYTTYSTKDAGNYGIVSSNGNGGNNGLHGIADGYGAGGGGFNTNGENCYNFNGISFNNIINNSNLSIPTLLNVGGLGGFIGGATGGSSFNITNLIWGGGGGGGYSGGLGGSASINGITLGGGGGGSYDYNGINNNGTMIGYNISNGYIKIKYLTNESFDIYTKINNNIIKKDLILLLEIYNKNCYDINIPYSIINLMNGCFCSFNKIVNIQNNYLILISNTLIIPNNNIKSISLLYRININDNNFNLINNITIYYYYFNNNIIYNNINNINNVSTSWKFITLIGDFNTSTISLFNNILNANLGIVMCYNRIISLEEHIINYNSYNNIYI